MSRFALALSLAVFLLGCKADEQCERMRLDLAKAWGGLKTSANQRTLAGVDVEGWTRVEAKTALLESSFMTQRVTWQSAEKARSELLEMLKGRSTDSEANLTGYMLSVDAANKQQIAFTERCR